MTSFTPHLRLPFLFALGTSLLACERSPTINEPTCGRADLRVVFPSGERTFERMDAAFLVYNPGPGPEQRAMYLTFGTTPQADPPLEVEFFQLLSNNQESPTAGTFPAQYGATSDDAAMGGNVLLLRDAGRTQYFPIREQSNVTLAEVEQECVRGQVAMVVRRQYGGADSVGTVVGTFTARRVLSFGDLPHPLSSPGPSQGVHRVRGPVGGAAHSSLAPRP